MANGTEWTEPGQGATNGELWDAIAESGIDGERPALMSLHSALYCDRIYRTNLKLTGAPLTAEDLRRIEQCKVK